MTLMDLAAEAGMEGEPGCSVSQALDPGSPRKGCTHPPLLASPPQVKNPSSSAPLRMTEATILQRASFLFDNSPLLEP